MDKVWYHTYHEMCEKMEKLEEKLIEIVFQDTDKCIKYTTVKNMWYEQMYACIQESMNSMDDKLCDVLTEKLNYGLRVTTVTFWDMKEMGEPSDDDEEEPPLHLMLALRELLIKNIKEFVEDMLHDMIDYVFEMDSSSRHLLPTKRKPIQIEEMFGHSYNRAIKIQRVATMLSEGFEEESLDSSTSVEGSSEDDI